MTRIQAQRHARTLNAGEVGTEVRFISELIHAGNWIVVEYHGHKRIGEAKRR